MGACTVLALPELTDLADSLQQLGPEASQLSLLRIPTGSASIESINDVIYVEGKGRRMCSL